MFERYDTGQESDRSLAAWLNAKGARTAKDREFCADTVRDMLRNAAYCGYVSGQRDTAKTIKGLHEPIVPEDLFDRVQERRAYKAKVQAAEPTIRRVPTEQATTLRALRRTYARQPWITATRPPLPMLWQASRPRLRAADYQGRAAREPASRLTSTCEQWCSTRSPGKQTEMAPDPTGARNLPSNYAAYKTYSCSATSPKRNTSCAAKQSKTS
jgi:hypothetical protein